MNAIDFRLYLQSVRQAACDAQRARDALLAAEHALTRVSSASADGTHVSFGSVSYDRTLNRVESYESTRARQGTRLHDALAVLNRFRSELDESPLNDRACNALWLRIVSGLSYEQIGERLEVSAATAWRIVRDAEQVLGESLGVTDVPKRQATPTGG